MWKCEKCGHHQFEEVMDNVSVTTRCWIEFGEVVYGTQTNSGDPDELRYQCTECGKVIKDVNNEDELLEYMKKFS